MARHDVDHTKLTQQQRQELETLGRLRTSQDEEYSNVHGYLLEDWLIYQDTPSALRIRREAASGSKRYAQGQLVAVRPAGARSFLLGEVRWVVAAANGELRAGVRTPGLARTSRRGGAARARAAGRLARIPRRRGSV